MWVLDCTCPIGKLSRAHVRQHVFSLPPLQSTTTALKRFRTRARVCGEPPGCGLSLPLGCNASRDACAVQGSLSLLPTTERRCWIQDASHVHVRDPSRGRYLLSGWATRALGS